MILLKHLISEHFSFPNDDIGSDFDEMRDAVRSEWLSGQKHQSWRLVPKRLLNAVWLTYAKYGRVNEEGLEKIWEIIKENAIKIILNSEIRHGLLDDEFFNVQDGEEVPEEVLNRWAEFVSDQSLRSGFSRSDADASLPQGYCRYSDEHNRLFKLLEACYNSETPETRIITIDTLINFVHGIGYMAAWFVEGGKASLTSLRDTDVKGIHLKGKLSEKGKNNPQ